MARLIDPKKKVISHILTRDHNIAVSGSSGVKKTLQWFCNDRHPKDIIIVDNKESGIVETENLVPIIDFDPSKEDRRLQNLTQYLLSFHDIEDVRIKLKQDWVP